MLSKSQHKLISSLDHKKYRTQHGLFIVEGVKGITEFIKSGIELHSLFAVEDFGIQPYQEISEAELKRISQLKTPNKALGIFRIPQPISPKEDALVLALDSVRDPGNLGTIIRLCDWFGITDLVCSHDTVDCYNPKVVQASMGSLARVNINYLDLKKFLVNSDLPVYGTMLNGNSIYSINKPEKAIMVLGNEANGISDEILKEVDHKITIPRFNKSSSVESLNVATATAILLNEFKRSSIEK